MSRIMRFNGLENWILIIFSMLNYFWYICYIVFYFWVFKVVLLFNRILFCTCDFGKNLILVLCNHGWWYRNSNIWCWQKWTPELVCCYRTNFLVREIEDTIRDDKSQERSFSLSLLPPTLTTYSPPPLFFSFL